MVVWTIALALSLTTQAEVDPSDRPRPTDLNQGVAESITLRDGSRIEGRIMTIPSARVSGKSRGGTASKGGQPVLIVVRRGWAEAHQQGRLAAWEKGAEPEIRRGLEQKKIRLERWRRERSANLAGDRRQNDRILGWIDRELARIDTPGKASNSPLLIVKIPQAEVSSVDHRPAAVTRLLALGWVCNIPEPERMTAAEIREAIESRGLMAETNRPVSLDALLPPIAETEARWLARRAATEIGVDPDLRFIRFQDLVLPDSKEIQSIDQIGLASGLSGLKNLLNPEENRQDPLVERFEKIEASGRAGALVTRLAMAPDFSSATVEITLWARVAPRKWLPAGSEMATVRTADLGADAGQHLAADPQVQSALNVAESLGLGQVVGDLKEKSLKAGEATRRALDQARTASVASLDGLAYPVFAPSLDAEREARESGPADAPKDRKPGE